MKTLNEVLQMDCFGGVAPAVGDYVVVMERSEEMLAAAYTLAATPHFTKTLRMLVETHYQNIYSFTDSEWDQILWMVKILRFPDEFQVGDHVKFAWEGEALMVEGVVKHLTGSYITILPHGAEDRAGNRYVVLQEMCMFDD